MITTEEPINSSATSQWLGRIAAVILLLLFSMNGKAQTGTEFWFAAPMVTKGHTDRPIAIRLINLEKKNTITIDQPANSGFKPITVTILPGRATSVDLTPFIGDIESGTSMTMTKKGIRIVGTQKFQAFYEVISSKYNKDIFTLKGDNAVGTKFIVPSQNVWNLDTTRFNPRPTAEINIVSVEDNNLITVTTKVPLDGSSNNVNTFFLKKGQTVSIKSLYGAPDKMLTGTEISSKKGIAVTISEDSMRKNSFGGCADLIGDQVVPEENLGNEYIVIRGGLTGNSSDDRDYVFVTGIKDNTVVYYDTGSMIVDRGETKSLLLKGGNNKTETLYSNDDFAVTQVSGYGCEVGMALIPPLSCTGSKSVEVYRTTKESFYLLILVPKGGEHLFSTRPPNLFNSGHFSPVPNSNYMYLRKSFGTGQIKVGTSVRVENQKYSFQLGISNGGKKSGCNFGFFTDFIKMKTYSIFHM